MRETTMMVKRDLLLRREIDDRLDELVTKAQGLIDQKRVASRASRLEKRQFDNVLSVATETGSVEVVKNFIKYQVGRPGAVGEGWRHNGFGEAVVEEIDGWLHEQAEAISHKLLADAAVPTKEIWIELVRLYLGYMRRWFVYRAREREGGR
ncbi:MAG TPA: hypothetical protein EYH31_07660 [Anaerolineae bacterium]|nr:hypothetical protein [Anaerolineae bacterium]